MSENSAPQTPSKSSAVAMKDTAVEPRAPVRLGIIVPSSNTSLEPLSQAIVADISTPERPVSVHFTRIPMTRLDASEGSAKQFSKEAFLSAAQLLVDAKVDAIGWSGTSAGWLGFSRDEELCAFLTERFHIPTTTSTLALNKVLKLARITKLGLVTPYTEDLHSMIVENYAEMGYAIPASRSRCLGLSSNADIGGVGAQRLGELVREVVDAGADGVATFCTNWRAAHLVDGWEREWGVPVFDTVSTCVWDLCRLTEVDMGGASHWGRMFF